jgi:hypothetical protein
MSTAFCRHIRPSGRRCQSPALRHKPFCYHHESVNARLRTLHPPNDGTENILHPMNLDAQRLQREPMLAEYYAHTRSPLQLQFPALEDADSVQVAISMLLTALGQNRLDTKRASTMAYTLQVASNNARNLSHNERCPVRETVFDEAGNLLAPDEDPEEIIDAKMLFQELEQAIIDSDEDDEEDDDIDPADIDALIP